MFETVLDILLDAILDTLVILPFLLAMHILLEVYDYKVGSRVKPAKLLNGSAAPLIGAGVGLIPQCGFSVVATKLYSAKRISLAALIAVYISTSDEAIPILLSNPTSASKLIPLILIKFVLALIAAYSIFVISALTNRKKTAPVISTEANFSVKDDAHLNSNSDERELDALNEISATEEGVATEKNTQAAYAHECEAGDISHSSCGCSTCANHASQTFFGRFFVHPTLRSLKILVFIFAVNLGMGIIITLLGEDNLSAFLAKASFVQVPLSALVGLIPNCASSVVITQLYALGDLHLGACVAGLTINSGVAFTVLIKENKSLKQSIMIIAGLFLYAVAAGFIITLFTI